MSLIPCWLWLKHWLCLDIFLVSKCVKSQYCFSYRWSVFSSLPTVFFLVSDKNLLIFVICLSLSNFNAISQWIIGLGKEYLDTGNKTKINQTSWGFSKAKAERKFLIVFRLLKFIITFTFTAASCQYKKEKNQLLEVFLKYWKDWQLSELQEYYWQTIVSWH